MADAPRRFGPEDLGRQVAIGQLALDPAGELVAYTRRTIVDERDRIDLWTVEYAGGQPHRLTEGPSWDTTPRFSPDGGSIAFLSGAPDESAQAHLIGREGGDPGRLTEFPHGVVDLAWMPDGHTLIALAEDERPPGEVPAPDGGEPTAQVIDRIDWRNDVELTEIRRPRHLHRVPIEGGQPERLTSGAWSASNPRVAADGTVLFLADPRPGADLQPAPQVQKLTGACFGGSRSTCRREADAAQSKTGNLRRRARASMPRWIDSLTSVYFEST